MMPNEIKILNCKVNVIPKEVFLESVEDFIKAQSSHTIVFLNPHIILESIKNPEVMEYVNSSDMVVADGAGVLLGARMLGKRLPEKITGTDSMFSLAELCTKRGYKVYLLGSLPGVASKAAGVLLNRFPCLKIVGKRSGYFNSNEEDLLIEDIIKKDPDVLVVCLGVPKQELWIKKHKERLNVPIIFGNGAALDFLANRFRRAPNWVQKMGLEWIFRLIQEPGRLWKRYFIGNMVFIYLVIKQRLRGL